MVLLLILSTLLFFPQSINENVAAANLIRSVSPIYPPAAALARIAGTVVLEAEINPEGAVANVKVVTGDPVLNKAAIDAVRQWRYKARMLNGQPKAVVTISLKIGPENKSAEERVRVDCGPLSVVRLYPTSSAAQPSGTLECDEEVVVLGATVSWLEVQQTEGNTRGWISSVNAPKGSGIPAPSPGDKPGGSIAQAHVDCAERPTLNIYDTPGARAIGRLPCDETVAVLTIDDPYAKIRTAAGLEGWVVVDSLKIGK